jgi:type I restriction enzyme S subunit
MKLKSVRAQWQVARLGDVTDISSGITLGRNFRGNSTRSVPYIRVANVKDGWLDLTDVKETEATEDEIQACRLEHGDILLTEGGDPDKLGRGTFWQNQIAECIHQNHIFRVRSDLANFDPAFLAFQFGSSYGKRYFLRHAKQTTGIASINKTVLSNFPLLIPPVAKQRQIAARLREQLAEVERARVAVQAQLDAAQGLPVALLRSVFDGGKWKWLRVDDLAETCSGTTPSRSRQDFYGGKIPWVKTGELVDGIIHDTEEHITETALRETSLRLLPKNTLLIAMYGQGQTRGRTASLACEATTNQACFAILPNEKFDPKFLQLWFQFSYARLRQASEGRGGNQSNFNGKVLGAEQVPLPPVPEQRAIVARLTTELTAARALVETLETRLAEIELLPAALLRSAFGGNAEN